MDIPAFAFFVQNQTFYGTHHHLFVILSVFVHNVSSLPLDVASLQHPCFCYENKPKIKVILHNIKDFSFSGRINLTTRNQMPEQQNRLL